MTPADTWRAAILLALSVAAPTAAAPPPGQSSQRSSPGPARENADSQTGTAIIRGLVIADGMDVRPPIPNARVSIGGGPDIDPVFTDGSGRFEFTALPAGRYTLIAEKTGYARTRYGSPNFLDPLLVIEIADAALVDTVEIRMAKGAAISGRIVDDLGEPLVGAPVSVGVLQRVGGQSRLINVARPASDTNDLGEYRIGGLPAGRYVVSVAGASEEAPIAGAPPEWFRTFGWVRTFYQSAPALAAASPIVLGAGEERGGIDFTLTPFRSARVSVSFVDANGAPATGLVNLMQAQDGVILNNRGLPFSRGDTFKRTMTLDPGEWIAIGLIGNTAVSMTHVTLASGEETSLTVSPMRGARIAGRVVFDGSGTPPPVTSIRLDVREVGPDAAVPVRMFVPKGPVTAGPDGTFEIGNLFGTVEIFAAEPPRGWALKAVTKQQSLTDVEIVLTDRAATVGGSVTDARGQPVLDYTAIVFATDPDRWYQGSRFFNFTRPRPDGTFTIADLPPGEYYVAAVDWMHGNEGFGEWQDPAFLTAIAPRATRVTLRESQSASATPRLIVR